MGWFNEYPYKNLEDFNLDYILKHLRELLADYKTLDDWKKNFQEEYKKLIDFYNTIINGDFPQELKDAFIKFMTDNAVDLMGELVHMVFFGITDDGYFVAYIPESWDDIQFGTTGLDTIIAGEEYGRLVLSY